MKKKLKPVEGSADEDNREIEEANQIRLWAISAIQALLNVCVDIWERNKELIRKRTDIGDHFTREIIQSIVFIFLPLGERVHLTNRSITTNL